jgi:hypothetical protein
VRGAQRAHVVGERALIASLFEAQGAQFVGPASRAPRRPHGRRQGTDGSGDPREADPREADPLEPADGGADAG